jgi:hypothetical protein
MRKVLAFIMLMVFSVFSFAGCSKPSQEIGPEAPVTMEQVNTDGQYVARAYIESLFTDNRAVFEKCYPEGFLDKLGRASNSDLYDQYRSVMNINSNVLGTASAGHKDYTMENGFDEAGMRASICMITGLDYSAVGLGCCNHVVCNIYKYGRHPGLLLALFALILLCFLTGGNLLVPDQF